MSRNSNKTNNVLEIGSVLALATLVVFISFFTIFSLFTVMHSTDTPKTTPAPTPVSIEATPTPTAVPLPTQNPLREDLDYYTELSTNLWHQVQEDNILIANLEESVKLSESNPLYTQNSYGIPLTEEDFMYLCRMAETETHNAPLLSKMNVVSVALNRVKQGWGETVTEVITSPHQFVYDREEIEDTTRAAVLMVLVYGDTVQEAVYFHSQKYEIGYFEKYNASYLFTDEVGHSFYIANTYLSLTSLQDTQ